MGQAGIPNYRKLAFDLSAPNAPICVYCGFGIKEVLEVAHLDGDRKNCDLSNLAILCPTCHRMHDIDLIPTDVVARLRDEKRKPRWAKLTKDAAKKAVETKRKTPERMSEAARKAVITRKQRDIARGVNLQSATKSNAASESSPFLVEISTARFVTQPVSLTRSQGWPAIRVPS